MERILWLLLGSDSRLTKMLMERFSVSKSLKLPEDLHRKVSSSRMRCRVYTCVRRFTASSCFQLIFRIKKS